MKRLLSIAALVLAASSAHATQSLTTAPCTPSYGATSMRCSILNVSTTSSAYVDIVVHDYAGAVVETISNLFLTPGAGTAPGVLDSAYCEFRVTSGNKKYLRGMALYEDGNNLVMSIPAR